MLGLALGTVPAAGCAGGEAPEVMGHAPADAIEASQSEAYLDGRGERKVRKGKKELLEAEVPIGLGRPPEMYFEHYGVNPTIDTKEENVSSFALDVDTASYALARAYLERNELPDEASIRVEEFINYFDYAYAPPKDADFAFRAEVVPSPHREGYHVLQLGLRARDVELGTREPANLVFLVAASSSMAKAERMSLVRDTLRLLVDALDERDRISIVTYGDDARVVLEPTAGDDRDRILAAVDELKAEGSANVEAGLKAAYALAARNLARAGIDRVVLCSDGLANTGATEAEVLLAEVTRQAEEGIAISTVGVGMGSYNDALMEQLADRGNGNYAYVDRSSEAQRVFVENLTGTLQVVGYDAKLRVEFDEDAVARYRLVGYENRALTSEQFENDRSDAGEIGAGHSVTAIYEIQLRDSIGADTDLRQGGFAALAALGSTFGTIRLRYRRPGETVMERVEKPLSMSLVRASPTDASARMQLSIVVAAFAEKLRGSYWVRNMGWEAVQAAYAQLPPDLQIDPQVAELGLLIHSAARLGERGDKSQREKAVTRLDFDRLSVLK